MKTKAAKTNLVTEYLNSYILCGGFWAPRWCWIQIDNAAGIPQKLQNYKHCGESYSREEIEEAGVWAVHSIEEIKVICGEYL